MRITRLSCDCYGNSIKYFQSFEKQVLLLFVKTALLPLAPETDWWAYNFRACQRHHLAKATVFLVTQPNLEC